MTEVTLIHAFLERDGDWSGISEATIKVIQNKALQTAKWKRFYVEKLPSEVYLENTSDLFLFFLESI